MFDMRVLWRSGLLRRFVTLAPSINVMAYLLTDLVPECQKIKKGGLDQYGAERFGI